MEKNDINKNIIGKRCKCYMLGDLTKEFTSLSEAIKFVSILRKYSNLVKMKSKGNIYTYSFK